MSNTNATLDLSSGGTFTLNTSMREDGLRLDKLMLVTDTAVIPTGQGPLESPTCCGRRPASPLPWPSSIISAWKLPK